jgi:hypothetical protein
MIIVAPDLFPLKRSRRYTRERDAFLRESKGVDSAILADALGLTERFVIIYQRKLGIRPFSIPGRRNGA